MNAVIATTAIAQFFQFLIFQFLQGGVRFRKTNDCFAQIRKREVRAKR